MRTPVASEYGWQDARATCAHPYLFPRVARILGSLGLRADRRRMLDVGCGNGSLTARWASLGWDVVGIDPSEDGIRLARAAHPSLRLELASGYDDLAAKFGSFPVVVSLEVVEHLYAPREYAGRIFEVLEPGGVFILSTPYHGYWKNLALAASGQLDRHFTALWDHGHIKFWSQRTLGSLLGEAGFRVGQTFRVGRIPPLAKSMIVVAKKPTETTEGR